MKSSELTPLSLLLEVLQDEPSSDLIYRRRFPIYYGSLEQRTWGTDEDPPFFNRLNAILALIDHAFNEDDRKPKPPAALFTTTPGFGKTRLLAEWPARALSSPAIIRAFLHGESRVNLTVTTPVKEQLESAKSDPRLQPRVIFLLKLHQTVARKRILIVNHSLTEVLKDSGSAPDAAKKILLTNILARWKGCKTLLDDKLVQMTEDYLSGQEPSKLLEIFSACINHHEPIVPPLVHIPNVSIENTLTLVSIDECQDLINKPLPLSQNETFALAINRFFARLSTKQNQIFVVMTGTNAGRAARITEHSSFYLLCSLPLDPLLSVTYLDTVCQLVFGKSLALQQPEGPNTLSSFLSQKLYQRWMTCCGVPRAIEFFVTDLRNALQLRPIDGAPRDGGNRKKSTQQIKEEALLDTFDRIRRFPPRSSSAIYFEGSALETLRVEAALCLPKSPEQYMDTSIGPMMYQELEAKGVLIPFAFPTTAMEQIDAIPQREYTMPFFYPTEECEIPSFASFKHTPVPEHPTIRFDIVDITIRKAIQSWDSFSNSRTNPTLKGDLLEEAVAVTLWLRYKLKSPDNSKPVKLEELVPSLKAPEPGTKKQNTASISVGDLHADWNGVVKLVGMLSPATKNFQEIMDFIQTNKLIVINEDKSSFADVIIPLYNHNGTFEKFLLCQCRNIGRGQSKIGPAHLHQELSPLMKFCRKDVFVVIGPNLDTSPLSNRVNKGTPLGVQRAKDLAAWEKAGRLVLHNGDGWLSPWFVNTFRDLTAV